MTPELRDAWATALESGDYVQGMRQLTKVLPDGSMTFCCLGVLCDLAVKARVIPAAREVFSEEHGRGLAYGTEGATGLLPEEVAVWAGTWNRSFILTHDGVQYTAEHLNDGLSLLFPEIAKLIREQL